MSSVDVEPQFSKTINGTSLEIFEEIPIPQNLT